MTLIQLIMVGIGGFLGAISRYAISEKLNKQADATLPKGTLLVNLTGSFFLGVITGVRADLFLMLLFGTGFLGAFTTFSTLKVEMLEMKRNGDINMLWIYAGLTYGFGIILALLGFWIGKN